MSAVINGYYLETGYGFNPSKSTVNRIDGVDEYGRIEMGEMVFRGEWEECVRYAETH